MNRVGLGAWLAKFQENLPENCSSIARIRKTSPQDLHQLGFKLTAAHVKQVQRALRKEPLADELAATNEPAADQLRQLVPVQGRSADATDGSHQRQDVVLDENVVEGNGHDSASGQLDMSVDMNSNRDVEGSDDVQA